jgi:ferrous iron transport protein A
VRLDQLPLNQSARITGVNWDMLSTNEGRRLREFGFDDGMEVENLHRGWFLFKDPLAVRIGRMTIALRQAHAAAIMVEPV